MPYNTTAIPPRKEATGQTQLPLTRVRKIIAADPDIALCSNNAAFVVTLATELFIQYLSSEAQNMVKLDRKPRRNVQYKDVAQAVARVDRLEFLQDTVPTTVPFGKIKADAAAAQQKMRGSHPKASKPERLSTGAPTVASLTNGGGEGEDADAIAGGAPTTSRKKQQQLAFFTAPREKGGKHKSKAADVDIDIEADGSGLAAAAALAKAGAALGAAHEAGPNDQLQQDLLRMHGDVDMADD